MKTFKEVNRDVRLVESEEIDSEVFDFVEELEGKGFSRKDIIKKLKKQYKDLTNSEIDTILVLM